MSEDIQAAEKAFWSGDPIRESALDAIRRRPLRERLKNDPFLTDEERAQFLDMEGKPHLCPASQTLTLLAKEFRMRQQYDGDGPLNEKEDFHAVIGVVREELDRLWLGYHTEREKRLMVHADYENKITRLAAVRSDLKEIHGALLACDVPMAVMRAVGNLLAGLLQEEREKKAGQEFSVKVEPPVWGYHAKDCPRYLGEGSRWDPCRCKPPFPLGYATQAEWRRKHLSPDEFMHDAAEEEERAKARDEREKAEQEYRRTAGLCSLCGQKIDRVTAGTNTNSPCGHPAWGPKR